MGVPSFTPGEPGTTVPGSPGAGFLPFGFLPDQPSAPDGRYRVLFIHAHPDDESISTGATMALLAGRGVQVDLLTNTRGELGEVLPEDIRHLEQGLPKPATEYGPAREGQSLNDGGAALGQLRSAELDQASRVLGINGRAFLGEWPALAEGSEPRIFRDSGMSWGSDGRAQPDPLALNDPLALSRMPLEIPSAHAAAYIRRMRPDVVVSYAPDGGYGHPDHMRTHELTLRAIELAAEPESLQRSPSALEASTAEAWDVPLVHVIHSDRPADRQAQEELATLWVEGDLHTKLQAMAAHRSQMVIQGSSMAAGDGKFAPVSAREGFQTVRHGRGNAGRGNAGVEATAPRSTASDWLGRTLCAVVVGVVVALLGTLLHSRVAGGWPWGASLAVLLAASAMVMIGSWARSVLLGALVGVLAYLMSLWLSMPHGMLGLILDNLPGRVWLYGLAGVTVLYLAVMVMIRVVGRRRASRPAVSPNLPTSQQ